MVLTANFTMAQRGNVATNKGAQLSDTRCPTMCHRIATMKRP